MCVFIHFNKPAHMTILHFGATWQQVSSKCFERIGIEDIKFNFGVPPLLNMNL